MRLRDLLTMSTGHQVEAKFSTDTPWVRTFLWRIRSSTSRVRTSCTIRPAATCSRPSVKRPPARRCSTTCRPRLFGATGDREPGVGVQSAGSDAGRLWPETAPDVAKFGQLYLQKGTWGGRQLIPASRGSELGHGEAGLKRERSGEETGTRATASNSGAAGTAPTAAMARTASSASCCPPRTPWSRSPRTPRDMQAELNIVWDTLLPAFATFPAPRQSGRGRETHAHSGRAGGAGPGGQIAWVTLDALRARLDRCAPPMKALVKTEAAPGLWLEDVPEPGRHQRCAHQGRKTSICGTDVHIYNWDAWAQKTIPVPMIIGHEFVGEIVAVGSNVNDFSRAMSSAARDTSSAGGAAIAWPAAATSARTRAASA